MNKDEYEPEEPMVEDPKKLIRAELELLTEKELKEQLKEPVPPWAWVFPIVFMFLGGLISCIVFSKRRGAVWLLIVGLIMQIASGVLYRLIVG